MKMPVKFLLLCGTLLALCLAAHAQGTAFTYQGRLKAGAGPASGSYDLTFTLYNTNSSGVAVAGPVTNSATAVSNGLFTTTVDFGPGVFTAGSNWLEIAVSTNGANIFTTLSPRQQLTPVPSAITAENLAGVVENNTIQGGVSMATISGGSGNAIQTGANNATIGGGVNNTIGVNSSIAAIGGGANNSIGANDDTSTIAGGNSNLIQDGAGVSTIAGGVENEIQTGSPRSTISGGSNNQIFDNSQHSVIGGGGGNQILEYSVYSIISGGDGNQIQASADDSTISGGQGNLIESNAFYSTIGGGVQNTIQTNDETSTIAGGNVNAIENDSGLSTIGGGGENTIGTNDQASTIGGGQANGIGANAAFSTIGGGFDNFVGAPFSFIGGGEENTANGSNATVGGGFRNTATNESTTVGGGAANTASGIAATVSGGVGNIASGTNANVNGGLQNTASGFAAAVPGGELNTASGNFSFAAGREAQATNNGAFVWADSQFPISQGVLFSSTASNQFLIRAGGGVGINTNNPNGASLYVLGNRTGVAPNAFQNPVAVFENTSTATGSSPALRVIVDGGDSPSGALTVSANGTGNIAQFGNRTAFVVTIANDGTIFSKGSALTSDRNVKENFASLDGKTVLAKVISLPVTEWNYKDDAADKKHIGPMAQDFHAAFDLNGADDKHISLVDEGGVALAAIQGLNQKLSDDLNRQAVENASLKRQNNLLVQRMDELEAAVKSLAQKK